MEIYLYFPKNGKKDSISNGLPLLVFAMLSFLVFLFVFGPRVVIDSIVERQNGSACMIAGVRKLKDTRK